MTNTRQINAKMNPTRSNQIPIVALAKLNVAGHSSGTNDSEKITLIVDDTRFLIDIGKPCFGVLKIMLKLFSSYSQLSLRNIPTLSWVACSRQALNGKCRMNAESKKTKHLSNIHIPTNWDILDTLLQMEFRLAFFARFLNITNQVSSSAPAVFRFRNCEKLVIIFWFRLMRKLFVARTCADYFTN